MWRYAFQRSDISGDRLFLFNDLFIFKSAGEYEGNAQSNIFGKTDKGLSDRFQDVANLDGTAAEAWGSGIFWNFTLIPSE